MTTATKSELNRTMRLLVTTAFVIAIGVTFLYSVFELTLPSDAVLAATQGSRSVSPKPGYTSNGALIRPEGYREWIYIGTPLTPNDLNPPEAPFPEFHNVYIHPTDYSHWKKTGKFPDGTVIVKELVNVGSKTATSGKGYFMGEFVGLEALVKDSRRFKGEPGHWAFFSFGHKYPLADTTVRLPVATCSTCHQANGADDFVFTQYYPVLRGARKSGDATQK
jgi:Cytochrome P460